MTCRVGSLKPVRRDFDWKWKLVVRNAVLGSLSKYKRQRTFLSASGSGPCPAADLVVLTTRPTGRPNPAAAIAEAAPIELLVLIGPLVLSAPGEIGAAVGGPVATFGSWESFGDLFNLNTVSWIPGHGIISKKKVSDFAKTRK